MDECWDDGESFLPPQQQDHQVYVPPARRSNEAHWGRSNNLDSYSNQYSANSASNNFREDRPRNDSREFSNRGRRTFSRGGGGRSEGNWRSNEESSEIQISSSFVGRVIGRGGSKIQELQTESGAHIKILQDSDVDGATSIRLTGSAEAREKAKNMIEELTTDSSRMSSNRNFSNSENAMYNNAGKADGFNSAISHFSSGSEESFDIEIESNYVGKVIGRGGSKIQELQTESGAHIKILQDSDVDGMTSVRLTGSAEARGKAKSMIEELTVDSSRMSSNRNFSNSENTSFNNGGKADSFSSSFSHFNSGSEESFDIEIDSNYVGKVIGRGGSKIQELQTESGAHIKILQDSDVDGATSIRLTGSAEAREKAKSMIEELTTDFSRMSTNRNFYRSNNSENSSFNNEVKADGVNSFIDWDELNKQCDREREIRLAALPKLKKNFYTEDPAVAAMTQQEVDQFRAENNSISVMNVDVDDTKPIKNPVTTFEQAFRHYPELLEELKKQGFSNPSPIQSQAWPIILSGHDLIGIAQTGTGKTIAFLFPALIHIVGQVTPREERIGPSCVILAPTRELAQQIEVEAKKYSYHNITSVCIYGGGNRREQINVVSRGVDIIIATPGRLNDLVMNNIIDVTGVTYLVLDEADRMLDLGFEPQIRKIVLDIRPDRQTIMTSATWTNEIQELAARYMTKPIKVNVGALDLAAVHSVTQQIIFAEDEDRRAILEDFLANMKEDEKVIVFVERKSVADDLSSDLLLRGVELQSIHGDREQVDREQALNDIKTGYVRILIATDVASRGLDVKDITHVFNMYFPHNIEEYVHRVGRTGRAGRTGTAISIFTRQDWMHAESFIKILEEADQFVPQELYDMADRYRAWKRKKQAEDAEAGGFRRRGRGGGRRRF